MKPAARLFFCFPEPLVTDKARCVTTAKLCAHLQDYFDVALVTVSQAAGAREIEEHYGVTLDRAKIIKLPNRLLGIYSNGWFNRNLFRHLRVQAPGTVYVRHLKTAIALLKRRRPGLKVVYEAHEITCKTTTRPALVAQLRAAEALVYRAADGFVFIADTLREDIHREFELSPHARQITLPLGFDPPVAAPAKDFSRVEEIFYTGSLHHSKGVDCLIEAFVQVPEPVRLNLIGRADAGRLAELNARVARLGLGERVSFQPPVPHKTVSQILAARSRVCVLPNIAFNNERYTSPLKLFEYMGANNIVIYSGIPSVSSLFAGQSVGLEVSPADPGALAAALTRVVRRPLDYQPLAENARAFMQRYTWSARARRLADFIASL